VHASWEAFLSTEAPPLARCFALTTKGVRTPYEVAYQDGDYLVFGSETAGLPKPVQDFFPQEQKLRLPMRPNNRSLNLSNAVAVTVYEAWRQLGFNNLHE
jgi:tRNA (cytidine/uridine-2'-O-)-methyltransferase